MNLFDHNIWATIFLLLFIEVGLKIWLHSIWNHKIQSNVQKQTSDLCPEFFPSN